MRHFDKLVNGKPLILVTILLCAAIVYGFIEIILSNFSRICHGSCKYKSFFTPDHSVSPYSDIDYNTNVSNLVFSYPRIPGNVKGGGHEKVAIKRIPVILFWNLAFPETSDRALGHEFNAHSYLNCPLFYLRPEQDCFFTHNRSKLEMADAVIIQYRMWQKDLPPITYERPRNQVWTFYVWESPAHVYHWDWQVSSKAERQLASMKGFFNWTMTYRLDSTVPYPYGRFRLRKTPDLTRNYDRLAKKTKTAIWMSGHCNTASHREIYIRKLEEAGIDVDVVGSCVGSKNANAKEICERTGIFSTTDDCHQLINSTYKFYLAFENSLCRDYVTEKFFRGALLDTIPVVMNGANMSLFAPPHSYIDTRDFKTPEELASFMKMVGSNADLYNSYFYWKPYYDVEHTWEGMTYTKNLCSFCSTVHDYLSNNNGKASNFYYEDIEKWWVADSHCYDGKTSWERL